MKYIEDFIMMLKKHHDKDKITYEVTSTIPFESKENEVELNNIIPNNLKELYFQIDGFKISKPRKFELLESSRLTLLDNRYLVFAVFNETEMICFDISHVNDAGELDIINYDNKFLITLTLGSFLMNKVWAWVNRGREVWNEEVHPK